MHDLDSVEPDAHDLQTLDNVLTTAGAPPRTRAWLLKRAGAGLVAAGTIGAAGPVSSAFAARKDTAGDIATLVNTAATAEAFAILFLNEAINRSGGTPSGQSPLVDVLRAAGAAEYDHYAALTKAGAKPLTLHIWIPDALFGDGGATLFANIELAETLFVNAYLIGVTTLGNAGAAALARIAGEILGAEAEHRTLARTAQILLGSLNGVPDNLGFEQYRYKALTDIVSQLEGVGIGFGTQGKAPGRFYDYDGSKPGSFSEILANFPA